MASSTVSGAPEASDGTRGSETSSGIAIRESRSFVTADTSRRAATGFVRPPAMRLRAAARTVRG
jgi:hypothetical protein